MAFSSGSHPDIVCRIWLQLAALVSLEDCRGGSGRLPGALVPVPFPGGVCSHVNIITVAAVDRVPFQSDIGAFGTDYGSFHFVFDG